MNPVTPVDYETLIIAALLDPRRRRAALVKLKTYIETLQYRVLDLEHDLQMTEVQANMWRAQAYDFTDNLEDDEGIHDERRA